MVVVVKAMLLFWGEKLHTSFYLSLWKPTGSQTEYLEEGGFAMASG